MWFKVKKNHVLHWPEYAPYFGNAVGTCPGLVGRADRVWAMEDHIVEITHAAVRWCVEGINQQMHKLEQVPQKEMDVWLNKKKTTDQQRKRKLRLEKDAPPPVRRLKDDWDRRVSGKAASDPAAKAADAIKDAGVVPASDGAPAIDAADEGDGGDE